MLRKIRSRPHWFGRFRVEFQGPFFVCPIMYASLSLNLLECRSAAKTILCLAGVFLSLVGDGYCQTKSVATSMRGFGVPFRVNANDESFLEVQLYVSRDLGKSWQFHSRQSTDLEEFPFFADQDGTYWFALKTLNRDRRLIPCLLYTSPSPRDRQKSRMPSSA